ncbi:uncharacterized protein [Temnothorax nylanderi]|uniref:uncharacterized protein n=1 Tax=Temnothorax nylanderi TaxID=102681 RepID=UPI003A8BCD8A
MVSPSRSFFYTTGQRYGSDSIKLLKDWINIVTKSHTIKQQLIFLLRCRRQDMLPPHIKNLRTNVRFYRGSTNNLLDNYKKRYQRAMLNLEIKDLIQYGNFLRLKIEDTEKKLFLLLPEQLVINFIRLNNVKILRHKNLVKDRLVKKFEELKKKLQAQNPFSKIDNNKWFVNISTKVIPDSVKNILCLGDKFGLPISNLNKKDRLNSVLEVIKNVKYYNFKFPVKCLNGIRNSVSNTLSTFLNNSKHLNHIDRYVLNGFQMCKRFLIDNDDVLVTKADKGQITVVMDKSDYINRMTELLNDQSTYKKLNKDPITKITSKLNQLVKSWRDNDIIDQNLYKLLNCTNGNLPRCYGLPKVHKVGFPMRIIVSSIGSPLYNVASFLHETIHTSVKKPNSHVKDGWSFVDEIKNVSIGPDEILISLDVTALFTNIPKELVIMGIKKRWDDISQNTKMNLTQFLHAVELVLGSTSFYFNGQAYEQIFGSPMGSPLSPCLADIVMDDLETQCLASLDFVVPFFRRYVDDIFAIIPRSKIDVILDAFNGYHPRLQFTHEKEINGSISFLDTTVIRYKDKLITNWYRKPTFSDETPFRNQDQRTQE